MAAKLRPWHEILEQLWACSTAMAWANKNKELSAEEAYEKCPQLEWLGFLLDCAEPVLSRKQHIELRYELCKEAARKLPKKYHRYPDKVYKAHCEKDQKKLQAIYVEIKDIEWFGFGCAYDTHMSRRSRIRPTLWFANSNLEDTPEPVMEDLVSAKKQLKIFRKHIPFKTVMKGLLKNHPYICKQVS